MASSPPGYSPPQSHLSLPKKRPNLTLPPNPNPAKRRKASNVSATSSAHPLRQTSFPPADDPYHTNGQAVYSPVSNRSDSLDVDDELASAPGSIVGGKAKKGKKVTKPRGRPPKSTAASAIGSEAPSATGTPSRGRTAAASTNGQNQNEEDEGSDADEGEDNPADDTTMHADSKLTKASLDAEKERKALFVSALPPHHASRYELWNRIHLRKDIVRKLTNQTLSQSVPASVVTTINSYTKIFVGELVDRALEVQKEWTAANPTLPTGEPNVQKGDGLGQAKVEERDRGPLLPDHLREALRRYKGDRDGGTVGFTGLSLEGPQTAAVRNGGKRLFK